MNSTSAELVSIQALCPARAAASAFAFTLSRVTAGAADVVVGAAGCSCAIDTVPQRAINRPATPPSGSRIHFVEFCIAHVSQLRRVISAPDHAPSQEGKLETRS